MPNAEKWELKSMTNSNIPQQDNVSNCGVFVCMFCDYILIGGPPHSSRQEFLCSSRYIPKRIGKEKHKKTTVNLPNFNNASFFPASPPIFLLPISEYCHFPWQEKLVAPLIANLIGYLQCEDRVTKKGGKEDTYRLQK